MSMPPSEFSQSEHTCVALPLSRNGTFLEIEHPEALLCPFPATTTSLLLRQLTTMASKTVDSFHLFVKST